MLVKLNFNQNCIYYKIRPFPGILFKLSLQLFIVLYLYILKMFFLFGLVTRKRISLTCSKYIVINEDKGENMYIPVNKWQK